MTQEELKEFLDVPGIREKYKDWLFYSHCTCPITIEGFIFTLVSWKEDKDNCIWVIFTVDGKYFRELGSSDSYNGTDFPHWGSPEEVFPKEKTIIVYETNP